MSFPDRWGDLPDDELTARLISRGHLSPDAAAQLAAERDDPKRARAIDLLLDPNQGD